MTADDFVKLVRAGSEKLRVDNIVLNTGEREIRGKGMLRIGREEMNLDMVLDAGQIPPPQRSGVFTISDYWKLNGVIEDCLHFRCDHVGGGNRSTFASWEARKITVTFDLNPIELIPSRLDAMSREERARMWEDVRRKQNISTQSALSEHTSSEDRPVVGSVYFFARLIDYPLPTLLCKGTDVIRKNPYLGERTSGRLDTLMGEIEGFDFALIKENDTADVHVHLESKKDVLTSGHEGDWNKFHAFMKALAFTLGVHAWPYRIEYWQNDQKIADRVTSTRRLPKTVHAPFHLLDQFDFQDVVKKTTAFFEARSILSEEVAQILFLFREAADYAAVHGDITVLATCVLFESLINQIFKGLALDEKAVEEDAGLKLFQQAKAEVAKEISQQINLKGEGYDRLYRYVSSAQLFSTERKFQAVVKKFGLCWENDMERVFQSWKKARHPLVHGEGRTNQSEADQKDLMLAESRIAGAMNILVLKLIGYSGRMNASVFEDKHRQI